MTNFKSLTLALGASAILASQALAAHKVSLAQADGRWTMRVDGVDTYIKGFGGTNRPDVARANGANALRTWHGTPESARRDIDLAAAHGLYVMQGYWLPKDPALYRDEAFKATTRAEVAALAEALKDDDNLIVWGLGNEIELDGNNNDGVCWGFVNELAELVKSIDPNHLVATVIAHSPEALDSISRYAPALDVVGINSYGDIGKVAAMVRDSDYDGPYIVTEWGPTGWWETDTTEWGAPLEQTSEEKRRVYEQRYNDYIYGSADCIGSFVFLWGQKEERTPTWFSMFVEDSVDGLPLQGEATPMVEAMARVWNRTEPAAIAPVIEMMHINGRTPDESVTLRCGRVFTATVDAADREQSELTYVWEILHEATVTATGGAHEPRPDRVGEVVTTAVPSLATRVDEAGEYRLYVYVLDGTGYVSTANIPFRVE